MQHSPLATKKCQRVYWITSSHELAEPERPGRVSGALHLRLLYFPQIRGQGWTELAPIMKLGPP